MLDFILFSYSMNIFGNNWILGISEVYPLGNYVAAKDQNGNENAEWAAKKPTVNITTETFGDFTQVTWSVTNVPEGFTQDPEKELAQRKNMGISFAETKKDKTMLKAQTYDASFWQESTSICVEFSFFNSTITNILKNAPARLYTSAIMFPNRKDTASIRTKDTAAASRRPNRYNTNTIIIFGSPILIPGTAVKIGGSNAST